MFVDWWEVDEASEDYNAYKELQDLLFKVSHLSDEEEEHLALIIKDRNINFNPEGMDNRELKKYEKKRCALCGQVKPLSEFYPMAAYYSHYCRECTAIDSKRKRVRQAN